MNIILFWILIIILLIFSLVAQFLTVIWASIVHRYHQCKESRRNKIQEIVVVLLGSADDLKPYLEHPFKGYKTTEVAEVLVQNIKCIEGRYKHEMLDFLNRTGFLTELQDAFEKRVSKQDALNVIQLLTEFKHCTGRCNNACFDRSVDLIRPYMKSKDKHLREVACMSIASKDRPELLVEAVNSLRLGSNVPWVYFYRSMKFAENAFPEKISYFLNSTDYRVRLGAVTNLQNVKVPIDAELVSRLVLNDPNVLVRHAAMVALTRLHLPVGNEFLLDVLDQSDIKLKTLALDYIERMALNDMMPQIVDLVGHKNWDVAHRAASVILGFGSSGRLLLEDMSQKTHSRFQEVAKKVLNEEGG